jgi:hypothetical protein
MTRGKSNDLYCTGARDTNIKHAQLRMFCSKLNGHLFLLHVIESPECACGFNLEDNNHFLLHCPLYNVARHKMMVNISTILPNLNIDVDTLLYGTPENIVKSKHLFEAVHIFICETERL